MPKYQIKVNKVYQDQGHLEVSENFEEIINILHQVWSHYSTRQKEHFEISIVEVNELFLRPIFFYESKKIVRI